jgi:glutamate---cysteine ligase / carboxylate-amine ligase
VLEEGVFRAARFGVTARLPDPDGRLRPVPELLDEALALTREDARELNCVTELEHLRAIVDGGGGAARQREIYGIGGMDALLRELTRLTGGPDVPAAPAD